MRLQHAALLATLLATGGCAATPPPATTTPLALTAPPPTACKDRDDWNEATAPRRIHGDTWYVGSCGISVILVATPAGHVLIDGGPAAVGPHVLANLRALGIDPHDVRHLLASHPHLDHAGGLAALQAASGATLLALPAAADAYRRGRGDRSDPQFETTEAFAAVADVRTIADGESIEVGGLRFVAHATPGHTPGSTSWSWNSCDAAACVQVVYADSNSAISDDHYRYTDHPGYVAAFRAGQDALAKLPCDILLTPHPGGSALWERLRGEQALVDTGACKAYAGRGRAGLDARLEKEHDGETP